MCYTELSLVNKDKNQTHHTGNSWQIKLIITDLQQETNIYIMIVCVYDDKVKVEKISLDVAQGQKNSVPY